MSLPSMLARRAVESRLKRIRRGHLTLIEGERVTRFGDESCAPLEIRVRNPRFYSALAFGGSVGVGEAWANGWWTATDLTGVVRLMIQNREVLEELEGGWAWLSQPARRIRHALRANTRRGSRRNIGAHYDLSNDFFALFLDDTLTYSCGVFEAPGASLRDAQIAKYRRMASLLDLRPEEHVLEIGSGWGGFAIFAASHFGCRVTTTTISDEQYRVAVERVAAAGLADRVRLINSDYRDLTGLYDKLVSIEMIEAVGHEYFGTFFAKCAGLLRPNGRAAIQAITIADERYESARREVDFIKRHIFPGSCIPSRQVLARSAAAAGLSVVSDDEIGPHYAETLRRWRVNMKANSERIAALGFGDHVQRLWDFYFSYCEGGFLERSIGTTQLLLTPQAASGAAPIPRFAKREAA